MINLTIDGQEVKAFEGQTILEAARGKDGVGIIPTLCHSFIQSHLRAAKPCRVCVVELTEGEKTRYPFACMTPVKGGMVVNTNSDEVQKRRKEAVERLLKISSVQRLLDLAEEVGVDTSKLTLGEDECIVCGMCERACKDPKGPGTGAISLVKTDSLSYYEVSDDCFGCGDCVTACPLGTADIREKAILPKPKALQTA